MNSRVIALAATINQSNTRTDAQIARQVVPVGKWATEVCTIGSGRPSASRCPLTVSFHMTKPSDHLTEHWLKRLPFQQIFKIQNHPTSELPYP
ncbi:hypothetical protein AVEN_182036-1 [Araneus ventricosus]|uniref:Uncharacterized protein n=1 Tax=Araneus ventricosus TaxID=182803 RepID=A0A4Y2LFW3_ARAVE|nr:hypothetical protein AVEN_182036-1 [Araneus ventricosus]